MLSQTTSSTPRKAAKRGRKSKSSVPSGLMLIWWLRCRICPSSFGICLGNLSKTSYVSARNIFRRCYTVWHSSTTMRLTQLLMENLHSITYFGILYPKSPLLSSENKLVFLFANQQKHVLLCLLCWQNDGRNPKLFQLSWFVSAFAQKSAKLQQSLPTKEDEQQPLSFCPSLSKETLKFLLTGFYF